MFVDIIPSDVERANAGLRDAQRNAHGWHNPIAVALERTNPGTSVVVTHDFLHMASLHHHHACIEPLTKSARDYLCQFRLNRAGAVQRLCITSSPEYR